jgi:hypothetical protein
MNLTGGEIAEIIHKPNKKTIQTCQESSPDRRICEIEEARADTRRPRSGRSREGVAWECFYGVRSGKID